MIVNPQLWYGTRELKLTPPHFVKCSAPLTEASMEWVITKLKGRYTKEDLWDDDTDLFFVDAQSISFEDPVEAMLYELRWSGTK
jgi:hypothetical protein